jgi:CubicO group peptidase (beta-lactamase class C family)
LYAFIAAITIAFAPSDGLPARPASSVGMSAERLEIIDRIVSRGMTAGGYPGASVVVGRRGFSVFEKGYGRLGWTKASAVVVPDESIYDLASLTKVVGTATAAMILWDEGRLDLDAPVSRYLPSFSGGQKDDVTIRHLLTHTSGLPAGRDLRRLANSPWEARSVVMATPLACRPGACQVYSDLGADVLAFAVEAIAGQGLDGFLAERVFTPLGMNDTRFRPSNADRDRIAPTEVSSRRGYPLVGEVHDENAFALGGVAGHAGLFSTAADLSIFAQMMLNRGTYEGVRIVSDSAVDRFTKRISGTRALGWDTSDGEGTAGVHMGANAFGHTGFTGTSLWIDPDRDLFVVLLTNRVHAPKARRPAKVIADVRADLADAAVLSVVDDNILRMPASFRADKAVGWNRTASRRKPVVRRKPVATKTTTAKKATTTKATTSKKPAATAKKPTTSAKVSASKVPVTTKAATTKSAAKKPAAKTSTVAKKPAVKTSTAAKKPPAKTSTAAKTPAKATGARSG